MAERDVTVAMYNVGFGDCFLIRLPGPDRDRRVLIDCGSIKRGSAGKTDVVVEQLIADVTDPDGKPRIDVVVVTHRHKDHVSGFVNDGWRDVEVGEVWFPWTEDPDDDEARIVLEEMASFAAALRFEFELDRNRFGAAESELLSHVLDNTLGLSNEAAMDTLHRGFVGGAHGAQRRYLDRSMGTLTSELLPGVSIHVLGPSRDQEIIREMHPPSTESFLRAGAGGFGEGEGAEPLPFTRFIPSEQDIVPQKISDLLKQVSRESALLGAVALEQAVNNTSLMLVFELGEAVLFFPGDSQWGSWRCNLDDPRRRRLLERTTFYKVGHHGSHNATPVSFVNEVLNQHVGNPAGVWAATSVTKHGRFTSIPKPKLMTTLQEKLAADSRVVRSDKPPARGQEPKGLHVTRRNGKAIRYDFTVPTS